MPGPSECLPQKLKGLKHYRTTQRGGGLFSAIEHEQAVAAKTTGILKLRELIPWESFLPLLEEPKLLEGLS